MPGRQITLGPELLRLTIYRQPDYGAQMLPTWRRAMGTLMAVVVVIGTLVLVAMVVAPSAGAAGGCGGG
jgi:hypothetical protein